MSTEKPEQQQQPHDANNHGEVPLAEHDLAPRKEQSEKIRGGLEPTDGFRGVHITPPET